MDPESPPFVAVQSSTEGRRPVLSLNRALASLTLDRHGRVWVFQQSPDMGRISLWPTQYRDATASPDALFRRRDRHDDS